MKKLLLLVACIAMASCGTMSTLNSEQETDFALAGCFKAAGILKFLRGEYSGCKVSIHGLDDYEFEVKYEEGKTTARVSDDPETESEQ